jgi:hypothetical protein
MPPVLTDAPTLPDDVVEALRAGRKIEAIRRLRERRGVDLREAKEAVEAFERADEPPARPEPIGDATSSSGQVVVALLLAAIALAVAYWLLS